MDRGMKHSVVSTFLVLLSNDPVNKYPERVNAIYKVPNLLVFQLARTCFLQSHNVVGFFIGAALPCHALAASTAVQHHVRSRACHVAGLEQLGDFTSLVHRDGAKASRGRYLRHAIHTALVVLEPHVQPW